MKNPFLSALVFITALCAVIAGGLYALAGILVSRAGPEPGNVGFTQVVAANSWLTFTGIALLATLVLGGIVWKSPIALAREEYLTRLPRAKVEDDDH
jgi:hypothetical protein